jgi:peptidoglycan L-alanyl-D-glutamate endopeptidase CwlK
MELTVVSQKRLRTCHVDLQRVVELAVQDFPMIVVCGFRGEADQNAAFASGKSRDRWPTSRHNSTPATAVDLAPLPLDWRNTASFRALAVAVKAAAQKLGVEIEWAGDWKNFRGDLGHFQLKR